MSTTAVRLHRVYYGWWILSTAVVVATSYAFASLSQPVFYPELVGTFHWSRASVAAGGSIKLLVGAVMAPVNGTLIDRFGTKVVLSAGAFVTGSSLGLFYFVNSTWEYYFFSFLLGLGLSGIHHMPNQLLVANWFTRNRGLAVSVVTTAVGVGGAVIPLIASYLITTFGWRSAFLILGTFLAIPFLMILGIVREKPGSLDAEADVAPVVTAKGSGAASDPADTAATLSIWDVLKSPVFWLLSFGLMLMATSMFGVRDHMVLYLRDSGFSPAASAGVLSVILGASTLGRFFSGVLSDRFSARRILVLMFLLGGSSVLMLNFALGPIVELYLVPILFGLSYGAIISLKPLVIFEYFGTKKVGKIYGWVLACYIVGGSVGPLATGYLFDKTGSYSAAFVMNLLLACVALVAILVFARQASGRAVKTA